MTAIELADWIRRDERMPDDIFMIHEKFAKLSEEEKQEFRKQGFGDSLDMIYISAVEMKKRGTWDAYVEKWGKNQHKTRKERLEEFMKEHRINLAQ